MLMSASPTKAVPPGRSGVGVSVARSVAEDLEAILTPAHAAAPARRRLRLGVVRAGAKPAGRGREGPAARLGALFAVALLGVRSGLRRQFAALRP
jgi:hypothetical protein